MTISTMNYGGLKTEPFIFFFTDTFDPMGNSSLCIAARKLRRKNQLHNEPRNDSNSTHL